MSATLEILDSFSAEINGITYTGKQGETTDNVDDAFAVTLAGKIHDMTTSVATATVVKVWDKDTHQPTDFLYFHFWCDQDVYLQFVTAATNVVVKVRAKVPFVMSQNLLLAAANTTDITGGAEPTLAALDHVNVGNYSGNTANYAFKLML